jgi:hypothetical protein
LLLLELLLLLLPLECMAADEFDALLQQVALLNQLLHERLLGNTRVCRTLLGLHSTQHSTARDMT